MPSPWILATIIILALNIVCFVLFYLDKRKATLQQRRIAEKKLHLATLCLASPAAWVSMFTLRHKNAKPSFYLVTLLISILHVVVVYGVYKLFWVN